MDGKSDENVSHSQNTTSSTDTESTAAVYAIATETRSTELCDISSEAAISNNLMEIETPNIDSVAEVSKSSKDAINSEIITKVKDLNEPPMQNPPSAEVENIEAGNANTQTSASNDTAEHVNLATTQIAPAANEPQTKIKTEAIDENRKTDSTESFASVVVKSEENRHLVGVKNFITKSSLGLLAQYDSDSDEETNEITNIAEDDVVEVPIEASKDYRNKVVEIYSDSESDSSSSDSGVEYIAKIRKELDKQMDFEDDDDAEDDDDDESAAGKNKKKKGQSSMRVKGELGLEDLPPIQDLHITVPEEECIVLGKIHSIVDQLLLVSALPDSTLYDLDTVLFLDKGKRVLGEVFDVLGQVADPLYCVRFNSHKDIEEKGIKIGDAVYVAPKTEHTQFVVISSLMKIRGSDASWENDVEPPPRYLDYSDDEQEREARQRLRNKDRSANKDYDDHDEAAKRVRDDLDETASVSSVSTIDQTQTRNSQRGRRFNRGNANRTTHDANRQRFNNQRPPPQQMPRNPNAGSWHSNYHRPYSYNRPPMPMPMNSMYPPFPQYPHFTPSMPPPQSPTMFVPNPYAMRPPQLSPQMPPQRPIKTRSPSPPPPGLD